MELEGDLEALWRLRNLMWMSWRCNLMQVMGSNPGLATLVCGVPACSPCVYVGSLSESTVKKDADEAYWQL